MTRIDRWNRSAEWPLTGAALLFLVVYAVPIIQPELPLALVRSCSVITWVTWAVFALDYLIRVILADHRLRYIRRHWLDLLVVGLPLLRPLRLLRLVTLLTVVNRRATNNLRGRVAVYVAGGAALLGFCGALAVLSAERGAPGANIDTIGDALWWAITTMTTVGYGDRYPVTATGRLAAALLMVGGVAVLGAVTATLAAWIVEHVRVTEEAQTDTLGEEIAALRRQVAELSQALGVRQDDSGRATADPRSREVNP